MATCVVWLPHQQVFAISRHADCAAVLLDDETFISGDGVALNPRANRLGRGTTLNSDGDEHATKRSVLAHRLTPKAVRKMTSAVEEKGREHRRCGPEQAVRRRCRRSRDGAADVDRARSRGLARGRT
ncbi:hypothetical protein [Rhodococcus sovatensis]|uniref:Cytochrome P450 n=1 Tax=Rhodococcus sovatensis TaxID=1805840 RepID=A0ABZ2PLT9_9NOCA